jgi:hypothetical protein
MIILSYSYNKCGKGNITSLLDSIFWPDNILFAMCVVFQIACPDLCENQRQRREHPEFYHCEWKYVELHGCVGQMIEIELAIHFLKNPI